MKLINFVILLYLVSARIFGELDDRDEAYIQEIENRRDELPVASKPEPGGKKKIEKSGWLALNLHEKLKDRLIDKQGDKYDKIIRKFEQLTTNFNLLADEDTELFTEFGSPGTSVHIPLDPIAWQHMFGKNGSNYRSRKLKNKIATRSKNGKRYKHKINAKSQRLKERVLSEYPNRTRGLRGSHSHGFDGMTFGRRHLRKVRRGVDSVDKVFNRIRVRNMKLSDDSGGDGIISASAIPQIFDAGITVHNYSAAPSTHPMFADMLDRDGQPRNIVANITIPPPRILKDIMGNYNHIVLV
jgi:hypothetical protein